MARPTCPPHQAQGVGSGGSEAGSACRLPGTAASAQGHHGGPAAQASVRKRHIWDANGADRHADIAGGAGRQCSWAHRRPGAACKAHTARLLHLKGKVRRAVWAKRQAGVLGGTGGQAWRAQRCPATVKVHDGGTVGGAPVLEHRGRGRVEVGLLCPSFGGAPVATAASFGSDGSGKSNQPVGSPRTWYATCGAPSVGLRARLTK